VSDEALVLRARDGDELAFRRLRQRHRDIIRYHVIRRYAPGLDRADMEQEADWGFCKAVRCFDAEAGASFRTFASLCINRQVDTALKLATAGKHGPLNESESMDAPVAGTEEREAFGERFAAPESLTDPLERICAKETVASLLSTVSERFSGLERAAFLAVVVGGHSYEDVAEQEGVDLKAIDNAMQRCRKKLAPVLEEAA
jgi:RNA polymerase sporulation-specific sigma factor